MDHLQKAAKGVRGAFEMELDNGLELIDSVPRGPRHLHWAVMDPNGWYIKYWHIKLIVKS